MTEEELEDAQVHGIKRETKEVRQRSKQTLGNSIMIAEQIVEMGGNSLAMLKEQDERLYRVNRAADDASKFSHPCSAITSNNIF